MVSPSVRYRLLLVHLVLCITASTEAARILGLWPMPSHSHYAVGHKLLLELASRGHDITMVSPFNSQEAVPNYRNIYLEDLVPKVQEKIGPEFDFFSLEQLPSYQETVVHYHLGLVYSQLLLEDPQVQDLLNSNDTYDLVMVNMMHSEAMWGFSYRYNCPLIVVCSMDGTNFINYLVANPGPNSYVPDMFVPFSGHMNFLERLQNAVHSSIMQLHRYFYQLPQFNRLLHEFFPSAPRIEELLYSRTALILLNTHPSVLEAKPQVPNIIQVGGLHLDAPKKLPLDLQQFMDAATDGVIFFSMGSNLKSRNLNNSTRSAILRAFAKLKQTVIWKWEDEELPEKPPNVRIMKWCPQTDIMAHPNLKLFISHGGLLSMTEALNHGVPLLILPIFGDQKMNSAIAARKQYAIGIFQRDLTENTLSTALHELLHNPKYRQNAKNSAKLFRDRPVRPLDTALYWTEYVIRHRGAAHLRTAAMDLEWYQLYSIDLALGLLLVNLAIFFVFYQLIKRILRKIKLEDAKKINKCKKN